MKPTFSWSFMFEGWHLNFLKEMLEVVQRFLHVNSFSQNAFEQIPGITQSRNGIQDIKIGDLQPFFHLVPMQRHGYGCAWFWPDRKSTRLNSSHLVISYAVFCLQ